MNQMEKISGSTIRYKYLAPIAMLYITVMLCDMMLAYRMISFGSVTLAGGIFVLPLFYFLSDIISEVYGYQRARQVIWFMLLCAFIFAMFLSLINLLPRPAFWQEGAAYDLVFEHLFRIAIGGGFLAILFGAFINNYIITKWKVLIKGRHYWLRSFGATAVGEFVQNFMGCLILYLGVIPLAKVFELVVPLYLIQITEGLLLTIPGTILVALLKRAEGVDVYDYETNFNPLKISISNEYSSKE